MLNVSSFYITTNPMYKFFKKVQRTSSSNVLPSSCNHAKVSLYHELLQWSPFNNKKINNSLQLLLSGFYIFWTYYFFFLFAFLLAASVALSEDLMQKNTNPNTTVVRIPNTRYTLSGFSRSQSAHHSVKSSLIRNKTHWFSRKHLSWRLNILSLKSYIFIIWS